MNITHLSASDIAGGAARAAYRLHRGLLAAGHESRFLALYKDSSDPSVLEFAPPRNLSIRLRRRLTRLVLERSVPKLAVRHAGGSLFSDDRSQHGATVLRQLPETDVLNLHWVAGLFDYRKFFRKVSPHLPIVWTLHDMNPFTGGCHYDHRCGKFSGECGACPELSSSSPTDLSRQIWRRKQKAFGFCGSRQFHVVAPSRWLAAEAKKSALLAQRPVSVIPYGLDTERFQPRDRRLAREKYGVPPDTKTILFVADSAAEKRKGLSVLLEGLRALEHLNDFVFLAIGRGLESERPSSRFKTLGLVDDEVALSFVYACADVFVVPSLEDNLPNTAIEAMACGVPTVGSDAGGIPDVVRDGQTGFVVPAGNSGALKEALAAMLAQPQRRESMAKASRQIALQEYSLDVQAGRYASLYQTLTD